jgi:hypothetical protein
VVAAAHRHSIFDRSEIALQKLPKTEAFVVRSSSLRDHQALTRHAGKGAEAAPSVISPISMRSKIE